MQPKTDGKRYLPTANISKGLDSNLIDEYTKTNIGLIKKLSDQHRNDVESIIKKGFSEGFSTKAITEALRKKTGVNESKARFWANDQAGKFFGHATRLRQKKAGIPGYVWRTLEDGRVRDSHGMLHGKFFSWDDPPYVDGRHLHPGEDYRCRCFAEPALSEADGDANRMERMRHQDIDNHIEVDNDIKQDVSRAVDIYKSVLNIDSSEIKQKLKVLKMKPDDPDLGLSSGYYDPKTQEIFIDPKKSFGLTTVIHEMAHWLDHAVLGKGQALASKSRKFKKFRKAVKKSTAFKEMQKIKKSKITVDSDRFIYIIDNEEIKIPISATWLDYLVTDEEFFARSMEQYMTIVSMDEELKNQFQEKQREFYKVNGLNPYWTDEDFMGIKKSLDYIFKKQGWIK